MKSEEQPDYSKVDHIPTEEVEKDLQDTKNELENLQKRLETYNPHKGGQERVNHYITEGKIIKHKEFIKTLEGLLKWRKENTKETTKT